MVWPNLSAPLGQVMTLTPVGESRAVYELMLCEIIGCMRKFEGNEEKTSSLVEQIQAPVSFLISKIPSVIPVNSLFLSVNLLQNQLQTKICWFSDCRREIWAWC